MTDFTTNTHTHTQTYIYIYIYIYIILFTCSNRLKCYGIYVFSSIWCVFFFSLTGLIFNTNFYEHKHTHIHTHTRNIYIYIYIYIYIVNHRETVKWILHLNEFYTYILLNACKFSCLECSTSGVGVYKYMYRNGTNKTVTDSCVIMELSRHSYIQDPVKTLIGVKVDECKKLCLITQKVYLLLSFVGSCRDKETEYGSWIDRFSLAKRNNSMTRKIQQTETLNFLPGFPLPF